MVHYLEGGYKGDGDSLFTGVTGKKGGIMGTNYFWEDSNLTQEGSFSHWEQSASGIISPGKWSGFPEIGHFKDSAGQGDGPSCLTAFAKKCWTR